MLASSEGLNITRMSKMSTGFGGRQSIKLLKRSVSIILRSVTNIISNKWNQVSEETVLTETTGIHLGAGPFALFYSRHVSDEVLREPLIWPAKFTVCLSIHFQTEVSSRYRRLLKKTTESSSR